MLTDRNSDAFIPLPKGRAISQRSRGEPTPARPGLHVAAGPSEGPSPAKSDRALRVTAPFSWADTRHEYAQLPPLPNSNWPSPTNLFPCRIAIPGRTVAEGHESVKAERCWLARQEDENRLGHLLQSGSDRGSGAGRPNKPGWRAARPAWRTPPENRPGVALGWDSVNRRMHAN